MDPGRQPQGMWRVLHAHQGGLMQAGYARLIGPRGSFIGHAKVVTSPVTRSGQVMARQLNKSLKTGENQRHRVTARVVCIMRYQYPVTTNSRSNTGRRVFRLDRHERAAVILHSRQH